MNDNEFLQLLDEYISDEEIELKKSLDVDYIDTNIIHKTKSPFPQSASITMDTFVNDFLGISVDASNLYHCGLRKLESPLVLGVSNEFANKNPELVYQGFLLLVVDAKNDRGTYINPVHLLNYLDDDKFFETLRKKRINDLQKIYLIYDEYVRLIQEQQDFETILRATHKMKQAKIIKGLIKNKQL